MRPAGVLSVWSPHRNETLRATLERILGRIDSACDRSGRARGSARLVAVSKTFPAERVRAALAAGQGGLVFSAPARSLVFVALSGVVGMTLGDTALFAAVWPDDEVDDLGLRPDQKDRLRQLIYQLRQRVEPAVREQGGVDALCAFVDAHRKFADQNPGMTRALYVLWFQSLIADSPMRDAAIESLLGHRDRVRRIIEQGTHAELLGRKGHYHAMWQHQSGEFIGIEPVQKETG